LKTTGKDFQQMSQKEIPNLQIPFSKPRHVGYCLGCYRDNRLIYSIPLDAGTETLLGMPDRSNVINGDPLTKEEFAALFPHVVGTIELCWHDDLEFLIEGMNLPPTWKDR
jgi:hypothetical protein